MPERLFIPVTDVEAADTIISLTAPIAVSRSHQVTIIPASGPRYRDITVRATVAQDSIVVFEKHLNDAGITDEVEQFLIEGLPAIWTVDATSVHLFSRTLHFDNTIAEEQPTTPTQMHVRTIVFTDKEKATTGRYPEFIEPISFPSVERGMAYFPISLFAHAIVSKNQPDGNVLVRIPIIDDKGYTSGTGDILLTQREYVALKQICQSEQALDISKRRKS